MSLITKLQNEFTSITRERGRQYAAQARVRILRGSDHKIEARVQGSRLYSVNIDFADDVLSVVCDCPQFQDFGPCKHVWATLMTAEFRGLLTSAARSNVTLDADGVFPKEDGDGDEFLLRSPAPRFVTEPDQPAWKKRLDNMAKGAQTALRETEWPARREILYVVDVQASIVADGIAIRLMTRDQNRDGSGFKSEKALRIKRTMIARLPVNEDREILAALAGPLVHHAWGHSLDDLAVAESPLIRDPLSAMLMPLIARTGRCYTRQYSQPGKLIPLRWDDGGAWTFGLDVRPNSKAWQVTGAFQRGEERLELKHSILTTRGGFVFTKDSVAPITGSVPGEWIRDLSRAGPIIVKDDERDDLIESLLTTPGLPELSVPEELKYEEVTVALRPHLRIRGAQGKSNYQQSLRADLSFNYDGRIASAQDFARGFYDAAARTFVRRNADAEKAAEAQLAGLGFRYRSDYYNPTPTWELPPAKLSRAVRALVAEGWQIEADGKSFRKPSAFHLGVSTGLDWFELHGDVDFGGTNAKLPELLAAVRRGDSMVDLGDGTFGMVPEEWLQRIGMLVGAGAVEGDFIKFRKNQAGLLDALLAAQPESDCDEAFARVRTQLQSFQGVDAAEQPPGFAGTLRGYQCEGLGWMQFLQHFSFGGCLADDMGVGKTAQVLAMLETRRAAKERGDAIGPSLVVVPRSLIFNWKQEVERFTPRLRVLDYTGAARADNDFDRHDLILTTYGTLRRDAVRLKDVEFDYVILDEAQAVKNASTESAKAVRLLRGNYRLAMSGTPIENHLGELWSMFEFLNPGMLGAASVFKLSGAGARGPDEETRKLLAHALRPFILRRTKEQVAKELPAKTEQTLFCEMEPPQRKLYDELRDHYRASLMGRIEKDGLGKSKILVLEALLRLRQASCHPGLLDKNRLKEGSAKLDVLLGQLSQVVEEGHKALVFSQFTSFLSIVRDRLDSEGINYEYLDGKTADRQTCVERFQNDPDCKLFLISLKAGGLGLNLTAAEYVFLLDPWWNPAVEAQAVDRAHRIGQTKQVFAYRLIARDTVEEKVLELQKTKRDLAAAIITQDNSLIKNLSREDIEMLLA